MKVLLITSLLRQPGIYIYILIMARSYLKLIQLQLMNKENLRSNSLTTLHQGLYELGFDSKNTASIVLSSEENNVTIQAGYKQFHS